MLSDDVHLPPLTAAVLTRPLEELAYRPHARVPVAPAAGHEGADHVLKGHREGCTAPLTDDGQPCVRIAREALQRRT